jgi:hypothetical protein
VNCRWSAGPFAGERSRGFIVKRSASNAVCSNSSQCSCNVILFRGWGGAYTACYWHFTYAVYDHSSSIFMVVVRGT